MEAVLCPSNEQDTEAIYKQDDEVCDYFEWCASFLSAPKEPFTSYSSASSTCSSSPPSERSTPNASPYSTPEQYPPPSPDTSVQYFDSYLEESSRIVVPQVFQTINIGVYPPIQQHGHLVSSQQFAIQSSPLSHSHPLAHPLAHSGAYAAADSCKELLVIEHGKESQKRKAVVMEVAQVGTSLPEFEFNPVDVNGGLSPISMRPSPQLAQAFYRNCYEQLRMKMPVSPQGNTYEGYRVYVHTKLGYSGNAKRFKQGPDAGERAFMLEGEILNQNMEPIAQCQACEEYFRDSSRRILLIKNNVPIHIRNGEFQLQLKLMCCSSHHHSPFYFHFTLLDNLSKRVTMNSVFSVNVKQWKNMGSSGNKKRKTEER